MGLRPAVDGEIGSLLVMSCGRAGFPHSELVGLARPIEEDFMSDTDQRPVSELTYAELLAIQRDLEASAPEAEPAHDPPPLPVD
jgi:hypothetical protein